MKVKIVLKGMQEKPTVVTSYIQKSKLSLYMWYFT